MGGSLSECVRFPGSLRSSQVSRCWREHPLCLRKRHTLRTKPSVQIGRYPFVALGCHRDSDCRPFSGISFSVNFIFSIIPLLRNTHPLFPGPVVFRSKNTRRQPEHRQPGCLPQFVVSLSTVTPSVDAHRNGFPDTHRYTLTPTTLPMKRSLTPRS